VLVRQFCKAFCTTVRPTPNSSHSAASGSLVPGVRRWLITLSNTVW
jgi:hypothetical protein